MYCRHLTSSQHVSEPRMLKTQSIFPSWNFPHLLFPSHLFCIKKSLTYKEDSLEWCFFEGKKKDYYRYKISQPAYYYTEEAVSFLSESTLMFLDLFSYGNTFKRFSLKETIMTEVELYRWNLYLNNKVFVPSDTDCYSTCCLSLLA